MRVVPSLTIAIAICGLISAQSAYASDETAMEKASVQPLDSALEKLDSTSREQGAAEQKNAAATALGNSIPSPMLFVYEFSAKWCPSCKMLNPVVEKAARKYAGFARYLHIDVDKNKDVAGQLNIQQIPTVIIVDRNGRVLNRLTGYGQGAQIDIILDHYRNSAMAALSSPK